MATGTIKKNTNTKAQNEGQLEVFTYNGVLTFAFNGGNNWTSYSLDFTQSGIVLYRKLAAENEYSRIGAINWEGGGT